MCACINENKIVIKQRQKVLGLRKKKLQSNLTEINSKDIDHYYIKYMGTEDSGTWRSSSCSTPCHFADADLSRYKEERVELRLICVCELNCRKILTENEVR